MLREPIQQSIEEPLFTDVKREFIDRLQRGESRLCPCCGRHAKIYKRLFNSSMARALIWLYRRNGIDWFNLEQELRELIAAEPETPRSGDPAKARHWDLLIKAPKENKAAAGLYRMTPKGERFLEGHIRIPRHCYIFDDRRLKFSDDSTHIREALGDAFDYDELMRPVDRELELRL